MASVQPLALSISIMSVKYLARKRGVRSLDCDRRHCLPSAAEGAVRAAEPPGVRRHAAAALLARGRTSNVCLDVQCPKIAAYEAASGARLASAWFDSRRMPADVGTRPRSDVSLHTGRTLHLLARCVLKFSLVVDASLRS